MIAKQASRARSKGETRRESIMDAAEEVFSERGYYGSSMREISQRSGAALGLITHYFDSKETLLHNIVDRKRDMLLALIEESVAQACAAPEVTPQAIIRAFVEPFVRISSDEGSPLKYYVRLTSHFMSTYRMPELAEPLRRLRPVSDVFTRAMAQHLGISRDAESLLAAVYLIESALIFLTLDTDFVGDLSDGRLSRIDLDRFLDHAVTFFEGGVAALMRG